MELLSSIWLKWLISCYQEHQKSLFCDECLNEMFVLFRIKDDWWFSGINCTYTIHSYKNFQIYKRLSYFDNGITLAFNQDFRVKQCHSQSIGQAIRYAHYKKGLSIKEPVSISLVCVLFQEADKIVYQIKRIVPKVDIIFGTIHDNLINLSE